MKKHLFFTLTAALMSFCSYSQASDENPINKEFTELIENSNSFKGYKVVDFGALSALQNKTTNYVEDLKLEISEYETSLQSQEESIKELEAQLASVQGQLKEVTAEKDAISFLGMPFSKGSYTSMMWGIVGLLILTVALLVVRFRNSHSRTREAQKKLAESEKEFEAYRVKALEREQRMGRQLQDERNKHMKVAK